MSSPSQFKSGHALSQSIPPFWTRVPRFFLFPLYPSVILRVVAFAFVCAVGVMATSIPSILVATAGLSLLAWIFFLRFGSRVLSETSMGRLAPSDYPQWRDETLDYMPYKVSALLTLPGFVVGVIGAVFGGQPAMIANVAIMLVTPAALMALVVSRSLFTGLNPAASWSVISAIGKPYLLLCVFLFCLSSGQVLLTNQVVMNAVMPIFQKWMTLQAALQQVGPDDAADLFSAFWSDMSRMRSRLMGAWFLVNAVGMYFSLIAFNMLGYVLYQYHEALGLEVDEPKAGGRQASAVTDPESEKIASLIAEGKVDQALEVAYEAQRVDAENTATQERYNKLLHLAGKDDRLLNHSNKLIPLLLRKGQKRNALEAWRRCRERHPAYRPEDAGVVLQLAEAARANREPKLAMEILSGFDKAFKNHALLPEVYLLCARILSEDLHKDDMAERFIATLCNRYPQHASIEDALRLLDTIRRIRKAASNPGAPVTLS